MSIVVILDNYRNACYAGQTISGRLECDFPDEEKLRAIRIHFKGSAKTKWSEQRGSGKSRRTVHFFAEEDYFDETYNLLEGGEDFTLPAGKHTYPFAYIFPPQLPSSCDLQYGHIHYKIKGTVDRPWRFDYEHEFSLNVLSPLDLNYIPGLREQRSLAADKEVGVCCFQSGPVNMNISIPITGFVPGQEVNIGCYLQNMSNVTISEVKYKIHRSFEFIAHYPHTKHRMSSDCILKYLDGAIGAHGEKSWTTNFVIPSDQLVINLTNCSIINVSYILEVEAVLPFPHSNLSIEFPITIGTMPLAGINTSLPGPPIMENSLPQYPVGYNMPAILNPTAPVMTETNMPYEGQQQAFASNGNDLPTYIDATKEKM